MAELASKIPNLRDHLAVSAKRTFDLFAEDKDAE